VVYKEWEYNLNKKATSVKEIAFYGKLFQRLCLTNAVNFLVA
jgi:hypothetical protein